MNRPTSIQAENRVSREIVPSRLSSSRTETTLKPTSRSRSGPKTGKKSKAGDTNQKSSNKENELDTKQNKSARKSPSPDQKTPVKKLLSRITSKRTSLASLHNQEERKTPSKQGKLNSNSTPNALSEITSHTKPSQLETVKEENLMKDIGTDADPFLFYESIQQLYQPNDDQEEFNYLLQFNQENLNQVRTKLPLYDEIEFCDKTAAFIPASKEPAPPVPILPKVPSLPQYTFENKYSELSEFKDIFDQISLKKINHCFSPTTLRPEHFTKILVDIYEARNRLELTVKSAAKKRGLHSNGYFNFSIFFMDYFKLVYPVQIKREKFIFSFMWTLVHSKENEFLSVTKDLLKGHLQLKDLLNALMVMELVKYNIRRSNHMNNVDLAVVGGMFQHSDTILRLVKLVTISYDVEYKACFMEKFYMIKGNNDHMTVFDLIGKCVRAFNILEKEGLAPTLRPEVLPALASTLPPRTIYPSAAALDTNPPRHQELKPGAVEKVQLGDSCPHIGTIQDRSKPVKDHIKWNLWSDLPSPKRAAKPSNPANRESSTKLSQDYYPLTLDEKPRNITEKSADKKTARRAGNNGSQYKNFAEKTKRIIDTLDLDAEEEKDEIEGGYVPRSKSSKQLNNPAVNFVSNNEMDIFATFDELGKTMKTSDSMKKLDYRAQPKSSNINARRGSESKEVIPKQRDKESRRASVADSMSSFGPRYTNTKELSANYPADVRAPSTYFTPANNRSPKNLPSSNQPENSLDRFEKYIVGKDKSFVQNSQPHKLSKARWERQETRNKSNLLQKEVEKELYDRCLELLNDIISEINAKHRFAHDPEELKDSLTRLVQTKADALLHAAFTDNRMVWCGVLQINPDKMSYAETAIWESLRRTVTDAQSTTNEGLNRGLVYNIAFTLTEEPKVRLMVRKLVEAALRG